MGPKSNVKSLSMTMLLCLWAHELVSMIAEL